MGPTKCHMWLELDATDEPQTQRVLLFLFFFAAKIPFGGCFDI